MELVFFHNTLQQWFVAGGLFAVLLVALLLARRILGNRLVRIAEKTRTPIDDTLAGLLRGTRPLILALLALFAASLVLLLPDRLTQFARSMAVIALLVQGCLWGNALIAAWLDRQRGKREAGDTGVAGAHIIGLIARIALYSVLLLLVLDNLGVDVTALVAGLGVGGVAVALAVQNILGDLFACLSISFDKPFEVGDFIIVGDLLGAVEKIGLKTTRIRSLSGEQLVFSNTDLLNSRIRNYKRMMERRVVFGFGIVYQTPYDQIVEIPGLVRTIIAAQPDTRFDRAHFKAYGSSSLDFEVVYYVLTPDYNVYMDIQQAINLELYRAFEEKGVAFAYPTQTLYVQRENAS